MMGKQFKKKLRDLATLFLIGFIPSVSADTVLLVSREGVPSLVRQGNPTLRAAQLRIDEAAARMLGAGRLTNPELAVGATGNHRFKEGGLEVELAQQFPLTDRLQREREVTAADVEIARAEVRDVERQLIAKTREVVVRLLTVAERREIIARQQKVADDLSAFVAKVAERGEGSVLEAGQTKYEAARLGIEIGRLATEEASMLGQLRQLIGVEVGQAIRVDGDLAVAKVPREGVSGEKRADLEAAELSIARSKSAINLEQAQRLADLKVGLVAGFERSEDVPEGFENEGIIGIRASMPLPFWNKNEGEIAEAEARLARKEQERDALAADIRHEAATARAEMIKWLTMAREIDDDLLPLVEEQAERVERAYRNGQSDLQSVLRVRDQQLELMRSRVDALEQYHLARVRYEAALGQ